MSGCKKVVTFGEVMMRLSPPGYAKFSQANILELAYGGGEANVAISLAYLGLKCTHVTRFPDNPLGKSATQYLRHHWIDTDEVIYGEGKMGKYFVEKGAVHRSSEVVYERDDSAFSLISPHMINWERVLDGTDWFHFTGITPGISEGAAYNCLKAMDVANKFDIPISLDVHSRKNLWNYGVEQKEMMLQLIGGCDILIASPYELGNVLGIGKAEDSFERTSSKAANRFPRIKKIIDKNRDILSASHNRIQGLLWNGESVLYSPTFDVTHIVDRIGTGDAFAAGLIYGLINYEEDQEAIDFASAACALKHTVEGDANVVSVEDIDRLIKGNNSGRILR